LAGDSEERFRLDSKSGRLLVAKELDADHQSIYWLSVKGSLKLSDGTECVNYTQIRINIQDINDNSPRFDMSSVEASILEDHPIHDPFFAVQAIDKDRNEVVFLESKKQFFVKSSKSPFLERKSNI
jgi:hypothetical protein